MIRNFLDNMKTELRIQIRLITAKLIKKADFQHPLKNFWCDRNASLIFV